MGVTFRIHDEIRENKRESKTLRQGAILETIHADREKAFSKRLGRLIGKLLYVAFEHRERTKDASDAERANAEYALGLDYMAQYHQEVSDVTEGLAERGELIDLTGERGIAATPSQIETIALMLNAAMVRWKTRWEAETDPQ